MNLSRKTASGDYVSSFGSNLSYNEQSTDMDGLLTSKTVTSGSLGLDGEKLYSKELNSHISTQIGLHCMDNYDHVFFL